MKLDTRKTRSCNRHAVKPKRHRSSRVGARTPRPFQIILNSRPTWIPKSVWKSALPTRRLAIAVGCTPLVSWIAWICAYLANIQRGRDPDITFLYIGMGAAPLFLYMTQFVWWRSLTRRHDRILRKNSCLMCIECGYLLNGLPDNHACPECGTPYVFEEIRRCWEDWLGDSCNLSET